MFILHGTLRSILVMRAREVENSFFKIGVCPCLCFSESVCLYVCMSVYRRVCVSESVCLCMCVCVSVYAGMSLSVF